MEPSSQPAMESSIRLVDPPPPGAPLFRVEHLSKRFPVQGKRDSALVAVDDVSLGIRAGEAVGLVGESGCGKSTLVRVVTRLLDASAGRILFGDDDLAQVPAQRFARSPLRSRVQMVFQDPTDSLDPRATAFATISEPLRLLKGLPAAQCAPRVNELATQVGLPLELLPRFPHQLSGGQKARVGIARALASDPELLILDEPTSALDVSVQALILKLLDRLRTERGIAYLFVSHDLNVVRLLCDRVIVMYLGKIIESGNAREVFDHPLHPYTQALVSAIPGATTGPRVRLSGEVRSPIDPPATVCRFYGRCPIGVALCGREMPPLRDLGNGHCVACHFAGGDDGAR